MAAPAPAPAPAPAAAGPPAALPALDNLREKRRAVEAALTPGDVVRLQNMERRPELNGQRGLVCGVSMLGSVKVLMDDTGEQLAVPLDRVAKTGAIVIRGSG